MPRQRNDHEKIESLQLAPYAQLSSHSRGRLHPEDQHDFRTDFQRDRDRIIHSRAFRRLEYKSQVFLNHAGDHYRTRLTHTIEVTSIARSIARALRLNEDLTECIALAHDLGHAPFGHPGEETLNQLMRDHGGFEHNRQSLRIVQELELKYPEFNGLNLTVEVLEGLDKQHYRPFLVPAPADATDLQPSLEAQAADLADEIAYCCHDLDDALDAGLLRSEDLAGVALWKEAEEPTRHRYPNLPPERLQIYNVRCLLDVLVADAISTSSQNLQTLQPTQPDHARRHREKVIALSPANAGKKAALKSFLRERFYFHPMVAQANQKACEFLQQLFQLYVHKPHLMSEQFVRRQKKDGVHRAACDYMACMTDRYAMQQYERLIGPPTETVQAAHLEQSALL